MLLSKKKLHKIKKSKNQSQKKYNKKREKKKKGGRRRSFSKRKKHLNLKNKSLKFRIKKQKGGGNRINFQLKFLTSQNDEGNHIMKLINFKLPLSEFKNFLNTRISSDAVIKIIDDLTLSAPKDNLPTIENIELLREITVQPNNFEHIGEVVNIYNYKAIKHILIRNIPSPITGLKIFDALQKYISEDTDERRVGERTSLELANAVFSDGGDAANDGDTKSDDGPPLPSRQNTGDDGPPLPSRQNTNTNISVLDVAGDGSSPTTDESVDQKNYRGDERMHVYTDDIDKAIAQTKKEEKETKEKETKQGKTPWTKVPLSLGARDPIHKKGRDGPSYPHNLVFEMTTKNDADGTKTNINILDAGDGPLTVDAFNELLLKKYRFKKPRTKEENKGGDDDEEEDFGEEEKGEEGKKRQGQKQHDDDDDDDEEEDALTIEEGAVEIELPLSAVPTLGQTINIAGATEGNESRIVIEQQLTSDVLIGGGKIVIGGKRPEYKLHLNNPLLYKHEKPKGNLSDTNKKSLKKMKKTFLKQLKKKYPDSGVLKKMQKNFKLITYEELDKIQKGNQAVINSIKERAKETAATVFPDIPSGNNEPKQQEGTASPETQPETPVEEEEKKEEEKEEEKKEETETELEPAPQVTEEQSTEISNKINFRLDDNENDENNLIYYFINEYINQEREKEENNSEIKKIKEEKGKLEKQIVHDRKKVTETMEAWERKKKESENLQSEVEKLKQAIEEKNNKMENIGKKMMSGGGGLIPRRNPLSMPRRRKVTNNLKIKEEIRKLHKDIIVTNQKINKINFIPIFKDLEKVQDDVKRREKDISTLNERMDSIRGGHDITQEIIEEVRTNTEKIDENFLQTILPTREDNIFDLLNKYISIKNICIYRMRRPEYIGDTGGGILLRMGRGYGWCIDIWFSKLGSIDAKTQALFKNIEEQLSTVYKIIKTIEFKLKLFDIPDDYSTNPLLPELKKLLIYKLTIPNLISSKEIWIKFLNSIYDGMTDNKGIKALEDSSIFYKVFLENFPSDEKMWTNMACVFIIMETYILLPTIRIWSENYSKGLSPDKWWINVIFNTNIKKVFNDKNDEYIGINDNNGDVTGSVYARCFETTQYIAKIPLLIKDYFTHHPDNNKPNNKKITIRGNPTWFLNSSNENFVKNEKLYIKILNNLEAFNDFNLGQLQIKEIKSQNDKHGWYSKRLNLDSESILSPFYPPWKKKADEKAAKKKVDEAAKNKTKKNGGGKTKKNKTKKKKKKRFS